MTVIDGSWLRDWRRAHKYTQDTLALELGVKRQTIIAWERQSKIGRVVYLAIKALERDPDLRKVSGQASMRAVPSRKMLFSAEEAYGDPEAASKG